METRQLEQAFQPADLDVTPGSLAVEGMVEIVGPDLAVTPSFLVATDGCRSTVGYCPSACGLAGYCVAE